MSAMSDTGTLTGFQWAYSISQFLQGTIPDRDSPLYRDGKHHYQKATLP